MVSQHSGRRHRPKKVPPHRTNENGAGHRDEIHGQFVHEPLDSLSQEIRLITIFGREADCIECNLEVFPLEETPDFTACSYNWSSDNQSKDITVNGKSFLIGNVLWEFLQYLRRSQGGIKIWADSICINQLDSKEKSMQVSMMAEIYGKAEKVISWLGDSSFNTRAAMNYILEAERQLQSGSRKERIERDKYTLARRKLMLDLVDRKYWTRLWIIQEAVRARSLWVTTGDELLSWDVMRYWISEDFLDASQHPREWINAQKIYLAIGEMRDAGGQWIPLPQLIDSFADATCQIQHDKVYGLVALTEPAVRQSFQFDYALPFLEILLRNFHLWSSTNHAKRQAFCNIGLSSKLQPRSAYILSEIVDNLQKLYPPSDLEALRTQRKLRSKLTTSLKIKSMVISQRTTYHVSSPIEMGLIKSTDVQTLDLPPVYLITVEPPITSFKGQMRGDMIYSTAIPNKMDVLLITGYTCFFVRKRGRSFHCIGTGLLIRSDCEPKKAPDPNAWITHMMPDIQCDIVPDTWTISSGTSNNVTCHVKFNGPAIAEIYRNENKITSANGLPVPKWNLLAYMTKSGLWQRDPTNNGHLKADAICRADAGKNCTCVVSEPQKLNEIKVLLERKGKSGYEQVEGDSVIEQQK